MSGMMHPNTTTTESTPMPTMIPARAHTHMEHSALTVLLICMFIAILAIIVAVLFTLYDKTNPRTNQFEYAINHPIPNGRVIRNNDTEAMNASLLYIPNTPPARHRSRVDNPAFVIE